MMLINLLELHNLYCSATESYYKGDKNSVLEFFTWIKMMRDGHFPVTIVTESTYKEFSDIYLNE